MKARKAFMVFVLGSLMLGATACGIDSNDDKATDTSTLSIEYQSIPDAALQDSQAEIIQTNTEMSALNEDEVRDTKSLVMKIGDTLLDVTWEDNPSVEELKELAVSGLNVPMTMYGGFEQVGSIGKDITRDDKQTTTSAGDVVLYSGNQLVVFYGSNSWAYTRLGKINLSEKELKELLNKCDVTITFSVE